MATKHHNEQTFAYKGENGFNVQFTAYTTWTRCGFCHTVQTYYYDGVSFGLPTDTKKSYLNRTWERFDYETALKAAIKKLPKSEQAAVYAVIIDRKAQAETEKAEREIKAFQGLYNSLNDSNKKVLYGITANSEKDIKRLSVGMHMMKALQTA